MRDFRSKQARAPQVPPKEGRYIARSPFSQVSDESVDDVELGDTQSGFATQVPRAKSRKTKREGQATHPDLDRVCHIPNDDCDEEVLSQVGSEVCPSRERSASPAEAITSKTINSLLPATSKFSTGGKELDAKGGASLLSLLNFGRSGVQQTAKVKALTSLFGLPTTCANSNKTKCPSSQSTAKVHRDDAPVARKGNGTPGKETRNEISLEGGSASSHSSATALDLGGNNRGKGLSSHPPSPQRSPLVNNFPPQKQLQGHDAKQRQSFATESLTPTTEEDVNLKSEPSAYGVDEPQKKPKDPDQNSNNTHFMIQPVKDPWEVRLLKRANSDWTDNLNRACLA